MSLTDKKKFSYNVEKRKKIKEIKDNELNKECFDCGSCYPEYISINNGVFICKDCLKTHNKFPKEISTTLKNNLSSLNSKELEYMYLGGNQKLSEFINYEYPQLHKFKINILYQTKAMQYYRNFLKFMVHGGPKPIKPNENINAYELVDKNDFMIKSEKIKIKSNINNNNNKSYKKIINNININNNNINRRAHTKNHSVERVKIKCDRRLKTKTHKVQKDKDRDKRRNHLLYTDNDDHLKRHKSFYKEMNKLFGDNYDNDSLYLDETNINTNNTNNDDNKKVGEEKIKEDEKENEKEKDKNDNKNIKNIKIENKDVNINADENNNKTECKEYPIRHIYNNNFFTLSATKNIFMFTPNKDSIIYKHRKIKTAGNPMNNPAIKAVKDIYYKPKIPYLISKNKNNNELLFSIKENYNNKSEDLNHGKENSNNLNDSKKLNKLNTEVKALNSYTTYTRKYRKNYSINDILDKKKIIQDDSNNAYNEGNGDLNTNNDIKYYSRETYTRTNTLNNKKIENIIIENNNNNKNNTINNSKEKKTKNYIFHRNNTNKKNDDNNNKNKNDNNIENNNKIEIKEIKIEKITKNVNKNMHNESDINIKESKNKTILDNNIKDSQKRTIEDESIKNKRLNENKDIINENKVIVNEDKDIVNEKKDIINEKENKKENEKKNPEKIEEKGRFDKKDNNLQNKDKIIIKDYKNDNNKKTFDKKKNENINIIETKDKDKDKDSKDNKINNEIKNINININKENDKKKVEKEKITSKESGNKKSIEISKENESYYKKEQNKRPTMTLLARGRRDLKREFKKISNENSKETQNKAIRNSENSSTLPKKVDILNNQKENNINNNNEPPKKFSIRNKYKMKKLSEMINQ